MNIIIASSNKHKIEEFSTLLYPHKVYSPEEFGLSFNCEENGSTFIDNAKIKAEALWKVVRESKLSNVCVLADDSGLNVKALPNELGIRTARFGDTEEKKLSSKEKYLLLLDRLKDLPTEKRTAYFTCTLYLIYSAKVNNKNVKRVIKSTGKCLGRILTEPIGEGGFGYDPVFFCNKANKPMATLGKKKNVYSHRALAVKDLKEKISKELFSMKNNESNKILLRSEVPETDKWNLESMYKSEKAYVEDLNKFELMITEIESFKGRLSESPEKLLEALNFLTKFMILCENLYVYALLMTSSDVEDPQNQKRTNKISLLYAKALSSISYVEPEILKINNIESIINDDRFSDYKVYLSKLIRKKEHTLSDKEEKILAMHSELEGSYDDTFNVLTRVDMSFKDVGNKPLTLSNFKSFMIDKNRKIRREAYENYYSSFNSHKQTLASLYISSVKQDVFNVRVRNFKTVLEAELFEDNVPESVYTGLISAVHSGFSTLYSYYSLKKKVLNLDELKRYDVYVPLVSVPKKLTPYTEAVSIIKEALSPLGKEYNDILYKGLTTERWVDKYENKNKDSGAFSSGSFLSKPYILMNYKEDDIGDVFTLAHEGGHSMHSYYSKRNNPFFSFDYTTFEAEVASTFNEQLLANYFLSTSKNKKLKAYIISKLLDEIVGTLFRQTMFAEYELKCHTLHESGEPLTLQTLREIYKDLLNQYFGSEVVFEDYSDLECLLIPHFYNRYYVYKYATGISAAIALSERVLNGSEKELNDYLGFLKSGGSLFPIDSLKKAGVDMSTPEPVLHAIDHFSKLLDEFTSYI